MSYNLDNFKVKKLENFKIAVKDFNKKVFGKPQIDLETNEILFEGDCEVCEFEGILNNGFVEISRISIYGEGSGQFMCEYGNSLLEKSTGTLIATLVWESGDTVERVTFIDGKKETEEL